jgi:hypothetical protein
MEQWLVPRLNVRPIYGYGSFRKQCRLAQNIGRHFQDCHIRTPGTGDMNLPEQLKPGRGTQGPPRLCVCVCVTQN